ncbi:hypothetical protein E2C01_054764 [Portunus trituberculatus]|uniref:Uncharacterized protein n=1 Tax=Portunus trituberculatus TaxID=210409 RepID=A0A5B7GUT6_PORTR|nr:hypothetical protein [Portunus trituberculatus]
MNASSVAVAFGVLHMKSTSLLRQLFRACRMQSKINTRCITPPQRRDHPGAPPSAGTVFKQHNFLLLRCRVLCREGVGHIVYKVLSDVLPERCSVAGPPPARHTPTTSPGVVRSCVKMYRRPLNDAFLRSLHIHLPRVLPVLELAALSYATAKTTTFFCSFACASWESVLAGCGSCPCSTGRHSVTTTTTTTTTPLLLYITNTTNTTIITITILTSFLFITSITTSSSPPSPPPPPPPLP